MFIRPLRMQSPAMFKDGASANSWKTHNSCPGDGTAASVIEVGDYADEEITSAGIEGGVSDCTKTDGNWRCVPNGLNVSGTGRWIYLRTESDNNGIQSVHFKINTCPCSSANSRLRERFRLDHRSPSQPVRRSCRCVHHWDFQDRLRGNRKSRCKPCAFRQRRV